MHYKAGSLGDTAQTFWTPSNSLRSVPLSFAGATLELRGALTPGTPRVASKRPEGARIDPHLQRFLRDNPHPEP